MTERRGIGTFAFTWALLTALVLVFATPAGVASTTAEDTAAGPPWSVEQLRDWVEEHLVGGGFEPTVISPEDARSTTLGYQPLVTAPGGPWPEGEAGVDAFISASGIRAGWAADGSTVCPEAAQACATQSWCSGSGCPELPPAGQLHLRADDATLFPTITDEGAATLIHELGHVQQGYVFASPELLREVLDAEGFGRFSDRSGNPVPAVEGHAECYTQALIESSAYFADCPQPLKERAVHLLLEKRLP